MRTVDVSVEIHQLDYNRRTMEVSVGIHQLDYKRRTVDVSIGISTDTSTVLLL
jgi:hypothetical protein